MELKKKFLVGILAVSMVCIILQPNKVNAALQSNGGTPSTKTIGDWLLQIRQMQELGGTLGRTDTIDTTNLTSNATDLDIHMQKNTEYGAMAILSASAYGNPNKIENGGTTTGNSTGIVIKINSEWVSAGLSGMNITNFKNSVSRYKNTYTTNYVAKIGDAIKGTEGWHNGGTYWDISDNGGLLRSVSGSIFSYYAAKSNSLADLKNKKSSRAVIVVGTGI